MTDPSCSLVLETTYDSPSDAAIVERSIRREVGEIDGDRSRTTVERSGATVHVDIAATDVSALRAGITTWFGLLSVAESTVAVGARE